MSGITNAQKFYVAMAVVGLCTAAVLWEVLQLTKQSEEASAQLKAIASITQRHMESDMMHDAIRGDVLGAILSTKAPDMASAEDAQKDLTEHVENFISNAEGNMNEPGLDAAVKGKYEKLIQDIRNYGVGAGELVGQAAQGQAIDKTELDKFMELFGVLETGMGDVSDSIGAWAEAEQASIADHLAWVSRLAIVISVISLLLTAALPVFVMMMIFRPQSRVLSIFETKVVSAVGMFDSKASEVKSLADNLSGRIQESSMNASTVSDTAQKTSSNTDMVAAAAQEMNSSLGGVTEQVVQARTVVDQTVNELSRVKDISTRLSKSAHNVKEIIGLIDEVANKINLLSLNASIEAARAGDAGRGFAVVAQEVKSLAGQTQSSSQEIVKQINEVTAVSDEVMNVISFFQQSIETIQENVNRINTSITEQSAATNQITSEITENAARAKDIFTAAGSIVSSTGHAMTESDSVKEVADVVALKAREVSAELSSALAMFRQAM